MKNLSDCKKGESLADFHSKSIGRRQKNQSEMHEKLPARFQNVRGLLMFADITGTYSELHWNCQPLCSAASKLFQYRIIKNGPTTRPSHT